MTFTKTVRILTAQCQAPTVSWTKYRKFQTLRASNKCKHTNPEPKAVMSQPSRKKNQFSIGSTLSEPWVTQTVSQKSNLWTKWGTVWITLGTPLWNQERCSKMSRIHLTGRGWVSATVGRRIIYPVRDRFCLMDRNLSLPALVAGKSRQ